jgi:hypothetical protein
MSHAANRKAYYEAHKDEILANQKAYREAHKDDRKAYYEAHKDDHRGAHVCNILRVHKEELKDDPERLSTDFLIAIINGEGI